MNCVVNLFGEREKREKRRDLRHWFQPKITIRMFFNQSHTNGQLCFEMCAYLFFSFALRTLIRLLPKNVHVGFFSLFSLSSPRHTHTHQKHLFVWGRQNAYESKLWREIREKLTILITGSRENALGNNLLRPNKLRKMNARQTFSSSFALYHISCYILVEIFPKYHNPHRWHAFPFRFHFFFNSPSHLWVFAMKLVGTGWNMYHKSVYSVPKLLETDWNRSLFFLFFVVFRQQLPMSQIIIFRFPPFLSVSSRTSHMRFPFMFFATHHPHPTWRSYK